MFYKLITDGDYIVGVGESETCFYGCISEDELASHPINSTPVAPEGYEYRLNRHTMLFDLTKVERPIEPDEHQITPEEALAIIVGGSF